MDTNRLLITTIVLIVLIAVVIATSGYTVPFRTYFENKPVAPATQNATPIGASVGACNPTAENPHWRCVPRDSNGGACQLGGCLPSELQGLPPLYIREQRRVNPPVSGAVSGAAPGYASDYSRSPYSY